MLSADYKLTPVPSADYIEKNKPENSIKGILVYAVNTHKSIGKDGIANYDRTYTQIKQLFGHIVNQRALQNERSRQFRNRRWLTMRKK